MEERFHVVIYVNKNVLLYVSVMKIVPINVLIVIALKNVVKFVLIVRKIVQLDVFIQNAKKIVVNYVKENPVIKDVIN